MRRWIGTIIVATVVTGLATRTETGRTVATQSVSRIADAFDAGALTLSGISAKRRARLATVELVADFRPDHPVRRLALSVGLLWINIERDQQQYIKSCTATVIAPSRVMTNEHCINPGKDGKITGLTLWLGFTGPGSAESYAIELQPIEQDKNLDYALLAFRPISGPAAPPALAAAIVRDPVPGERIIVIHHAGGEVQQVSRAFCKVELSEPTSRPVIEHSCTTRPGSSGAVLIAETDHAIIGLHTSTVQNADRSPGFATRATAIPALRRIAGKP